MTSSAPTPDTIESLGMAPFASFAMLAGMKLDVFTPLKDGSKSAEEVAEIIGVGASKLSPLLYALIEAGLLTLDNGKFANTKESQCFLVKGLPTYLGGRHAYYTARWNEAFQTAESIMKGEAQAKLNFPAMSFEEQNAFLRGLHPASLATGRDLARSFDFSSVETLVDVGGGSGALSIALTEAWPNISATVFDLPAVARVAQNILTESGGSNQVQVLAGDIFQGDLPGPFDAAVVCHFTQIFSAQQARQALIRVGEMVKPGGEVYVVGFMLDNSRLAPRVPVLFNMVFINVFDGGQAHTEGEHREWLEEAGFTGFQRVSNPNGISFISATRK